MVKRDSIDTTKKLAEVAGVGKETYRQAKRVLDSDNKELRQRVLSGETSISAGYKELQNEKKKNQSNIDLDGEYNYEESNRRSILGKSL